MFRLAEDDRRLASQSLGRTLETTAILPTQCRNLQLNPDDQIAADLTDLRMKRPPTQIRESSSRNRKPSTIRSVADPSQEHSAKKTPLHGEAIDEKPTVFQQPARDNGLVLLSAWVSSEDEWDEFEWSHQRLAEQTAAENPDDVQVNEKVERRRQWIDAYLRWGRDTLGFGIYLLQKPDGCAVESQRKSKL